MQIRIIVDVSTVVYNHDVDTGEDTSYLRHFRCGETYRVGEISPANDVFDIVEFELLGFCEFPRGAYQRDFSRTSFVPDAICLN